jgi:hypothetical protein
LGGKDAYSRRGVSAWLGESDACNVGGEELDAVAVEVASGAVVVLGGGGSACRARIWASRSGTPASRAFVMAAWRSECGLMCLGIPAAFAIRLTNR